METFVSVLIIGKVNGITTPYPYVVLRIQDLLDKLSQAKWLSKLNLDKGYYKI